MGFPSVKDAGAGGIGLAVVEYPTVSGIPAVLPASRPATEASGTKVVPMGTASVTTNVNADPVE
jgi:hypothetical protein